MRFPIFARRANPSIDAPILRKSKSYVEAQVADYLAQWVDPNDKTKGIICRELLNFGPPKALPQQTSASLPPVELPGIHFEEPKSAKLGRRNPIVRLVSLVELGEAVGL